MKKKIVAGIVSVAFLVVPLGSVAGAAPCKLANVAKKTVCL